MRHIRSFFVFASLFILSIAGPSYAFDIAPHVQSLERVHDALKIDQGIIAVLPDVRTTAAPNERSANAEYTVQSQPVQSWRQIADAYRHIDPGRRVATA